MKKSNIKYEMKKKKRPPKGKSTLKGDLLAVGLIISKSINLETAFLYPITSLPLAIAEPDSTLRSSAKSVLRNFLIDESGALVTNAPKHCDWLVDRMAAVRAVKPRRTYKEWIKALIVYMTPPDDAEPIQFGMINDVYIKESVKSCTRSKRGESRGIVKVEGAEQHRQYGTRWSAFLCNGTNKTKLLKLIGVSMHTEEMKNLFKIPFIFTTEDKTYELNYNNTDMLF